MTVTENVTGKLILAVEIFDSDQNGTGIIGKYKPTSG
jgi:hypothetical protein